MLTTIKVYACYAVKIYRSKLGGVTQDILPLLKWPGWARTSDDVDVNTSFSKEVHLEHMYKGLSSLEACMYLVLRFSCN